MTMFIDCHPKRRMMAATADPAVILSIRTTKYLTCAVMVWFAFIMVKITGLQIISDTDTTLCYALILALLGSYRLYLGMRAPQATAFIEASSAFLMICILMFAANCLQYSFAMMPGLDATSTVQALDRLMGYDGPALISKVQHIPWMQDSLIWIYGSTGKQFLLAFVVLVFFSGNADFNRLVTRLMAGMILTTAISGLFHVLPYSPAEMMAQGIERTPRGINAWTAIKGLQDGSLRAMDIDTLQGLVSLPSFHMEMAVFFTLAFIRRRWLAMPVFILNALMALATLAEGGHYLTDLIAGGAVAAATVYILDKIEGQMLIYLEIQRFPVGYLQYFKDLKD